jgi:hypothetical protein
MSEFDVVAAPLGRQIILPVLYLEGLEFSARKSAFLTEVFVFCFSDSPANARIVSYVNIGDSFHTFLPITLSQLFFHPIEYNACNCESVVK